MPPTHKNSVVRTAHIDDYPALNIALHKLPVVSSTLWSPLDREGNATYTVNYFTDAKLGTDKQKREAIERTFDDYYAQKAATA